MPTPSTITRANARRLNITKQHLAAGDAPMFDVIRDLGCLQLDPISAVARSHQIVLWSRLGNYDLAELDKLVYGDRVLFEYWAHAASIVLTEHYPLHLAEMESYLTDGSAWSQRRAAWVAENDALREMLMETFRQHGPLASREIDYDAGKWGTQKGWSGNNLSRMIDYLWTRGELMVARREGIQRVWDITERVLPDWTPRERWDDDTRCRFAAAHALRALGVATEKHIKKHFIRGRYPNLAQNLGYMLGIGDILPVEVVKNNGDTLPGDWYIHRDDLPLLERIKNGEWHPRITLLSPFDNLICDRERTEQLFDFVFRLEIYVPKAKREYGYYVLPILHGDRLIGRIDTKYDRHTGILHLNTLYAEDDAPSGAAPAVHTAIESLAAWLGAEDVRYGMVAAALKQKPEGSPPA